MSDATQQFEMGEPDWSDPPPPGTGCAVCKRLGHFCPAKGWLGELAVCFPCGGGYACPQEMAVQRVHAGTGGYDEMEVETAPGECRSVPLELASPPVEERPSDWTLKAELRQENLVAAMKERRQREKPVRARKPKPLCMECGKEIPGRSASGRCGACYRASRMVKGEGQPRKVKTMAKKQCLGGCGRDVAISIAEKGGLYAWGCSAANGCRPRSADGSTAPKLTGIEATIAYTRKQLASAHVVEAQIAADIAALEAKIVGQRERLERERSHKVVLRELLDRIDPPVMLVGSSFV